MKVGDLVKRRRHGWLAIVLKRVNNTVHGDHITFAHVDTVFSREIDSASTSLFEVVSESR